MILIPPTIICGCRNVSCNKEHPVYCNECGDLVGTGGSDDPYNSVYIKCKACCYLGGIELINGATLQKDNSND